MQCQVLYSLNARGPSADDEEDFRTVHVGDMMTLSDPMFDIPEEFARIPLTVLRRASTSSSTPSPPTAAAVTTSSTPQRLL